jgi:manganese-dependent inorganic pyrophosphatase
MLGHPNKETIFILEQANMEHPILMQELPEQSHIALVDHNESGQSIDNRHIYTIHSVIDHHKIGDITTGHPVHMRFEPVASTNTILYKMYRDQNLEISQDIATLMLAGILSDTLHFRSPTTTPEDKAIVSVLQELAAIHDLESFAMDMFAAKSDLGEISAYDLIKNVDCKDFNFGGRKVAIACIETTNPQYCLGRKEELMEEMNRIKAEEGYNAIIFCIVDIIQEQNTTIVASESEANILSEVFGAITVDGLADLGNRISRKKQIIPDMERVLG